MTSTTRRLMLPWALALCAVALSPRSPTTANAADARASTRSRASSCAARPPINDAPCPAGVCLQLTDGTFRGTPVGTGAYTGSIELNVAEAFPNGEGGVCAPIRGEIVLGAGTPGPARARRRRRLLPGRRRQSR